MQSALADRKLECRSSFQGLLRKLVCFTLTAALLFLSAAVPALGGEKLPPRYREWLERDVAYLITREERQAFLALTRDEDRDHFIEQFWGVRNSTPEAPTNAEREEHYRRLAYADQHFGTGSGTDGWRTDRGRVYITLGPPAQKAVYLGYQNLRPMEIWFYSSAHPALPPFFYVVFYQQDNIGDFRLYSPYSDGPEKLITTLRAVNDRASALHIVDQSAGREVARTVLSLLPDEPVDMQSATSSLQSDLVISTIRNLANHPLTKEMLERRRLLERTSARLILEGETLGVLTASLRDPDGRTYLHYLLRFRQPEDFSLAEASDNRHYFSIGVRVRVFGPDQKEIFEQEKTLTRYLSRDQLERVKTKVFGYEGRLPLAPGKYRIEFLLTNWLKKAGHRVEKEVSVPEPPSSGIRMTEPVAFASAESLPPDQTGSPPFSAAGVKFVPLLPRELTLEPGREFKLFYQVWMPPGDPAERRQRKILVEYAYGRPGVQGDSKVLREELPAEQADAHGSLLNGKKLSLAELPYGNYLLSLTITDPDRQQKAYGSLAFRLAPGVAFPQAWDVTDDAAGADALAGVLDEQRGLCSLAQGDKAAAAVWHWITTPSENSRAGHLWTSCTPSRTLRRLPGWRGRRLSPARRKSARFSDSRRAWTGWGIPRAPPASSRIT